MILVLGEPTTSSTLCMRPTSHLHITADSEDLEDKTVSPNPSYNIFEFKGGQLADDEYYSNF